MKRSEIRGKSVAVLMGGWSAEREISLASGRAVMGALERRGYKCRAIDADRRLGEKLKAARPDVAFVALHGCGGEDGAVQGLLEVMGIPYTGSGVLSSAIAMNKKYSKWLFEFHSINTPPYLVTTTDEEIPGGEPPFGLPAVVKPLAEGSTIGVTIVREARGLKGSVREACRYGREALVEKYIEGRELTVGVIGRAVLPPLEIFTEREFYDYQAKYGAAGTSYKVPADVSPGLSRELGLLAQRASSVLGCRGAVRVDFRIDAGEVPYVLEVNTIPGMTETSLLPKAANAAGMSFEDLVEEIIFQSLEGR